MDNTAGLAMSHVEKEEHRAKIQAGHARIKKFVKEMYQLMKEKGIRIEGYFKLVEADTGIYLKMHK